MNKLTQRGRLTAKKLRPFIYLSLLVMMFLGAILASAQERRYQIVEKMYPKEVVKIVDVRNIQSEAFPQGFEIEIKNVSDKPIYYINIALTYRSSEYDRRVMPYGGNMSFGESRLYSFRERAREEDRSIKPGGSVVLRVSEAEWKCFNEKVLSGEIPRDTTNIVKIIFQHINFGDGTGMLGWQPQPVKEN